MRYFRRFCVAYFMVVLPFFAAKLLGLVIVPSTGADWAKFFVELLGQVVGILILAEICSLSREERTAETEKLDAAQRNELEKLAISLKRTEKTVKDKEVSYGYRNLVQRWLSVDIRIIEAPGKYVVTFPLTCQDHVRRIVLPALEHQVIE